MRGEMLGVFLLALMIFSFSVSLIPLSYLSYGSSGEIVRFGKRDIEIYMDFGILELSETNESEPYALIRGSISSEEGRVEGSIGSVSLFIPEGWKGLIRVTMGSGIVILNDIQVEELNVKMRLGFVQGEMVVLKGVLMDIGTGAVSLMLRVKEGSGVIVKLDCDRSYLRYDGESFRGKSVEMTLWEGNPQLQVEIRAKVAELNIIRMKG